MRRVLEPELMDDEAQAAAYARADFAEPNTLFCMQMAVRFGVLERARVVDLGCGPADIPIRLARIHRRWMFDVVDGSEAMLSHARREIENAGLEGRIRIFCSVLPAPGLSESDYDIVISNSLLHHMPQPDVFWNEVKRLARPGARVMIMDLARPISEDRVRAIVTRYAGEEPEVLQRDFRASLRAAFTPEEVEEQLALAGMSAMKVDMISDRHLLAYGLLTATAGVT